MNLSLVAFVQIHECLHIGDGGGHWTQANNDAKTLIWIRHCTIFRALIWSFQQNWSVTMTLTAKNNKPLTNLHTRHNQIVHPSWSTNNIQLRNNGQSSNEMLCDACGCVIHNVCIPFVIGTCHHSIFCWLIHIQLIESCTQLMRQHVMNESIFQHSMTKTETKISFTFSELQFPWTGIDLCELAICAN